MALTKPRAYQIYDIDYKQAVRVITVSNISLTLGAPNSVDGVNLSVNDRVLVAGQSSAAQNGIYYVTTLGSGSNGTWTRSIDTDTTGELLAGTIVMVTEGLVYADTQWKLTTNDPIVIGTTPLVFAQNSAFAYGNVYANGTAVLATTVGDVLTLSPGNNISIVGNNTSKTVSIGVTGISLNSISNGTSNVNVVSSGGNVTVGVAGTSNVAVFSSEGQNVTGYLTASGNISGGNILGNGRNLTGINTFSSIAVTGGDTITANSIATGLTFTGDTSIVITANTTTNTVSFAFGGSGESIFATGGDMCLVDEVPLTEEDLGLVTDAVTESYDLGGFFIEGLLSNDNFLVNSINGNILVANAVITTTGNITGGNLITGGLGSFGTTVTATGNITGGNLISNGQAVVTYTPATATGVALTVSAANTQGGTGYADFLRATNTSSGATNSNKTFRLSSTGSIEVINSAYNSVLLSLTNSGGLSVTGSISVSGKQAVNGPAFSAYPSSGTAQTITSGSQQKILFGTEEYDTNSNFASSRFTPTVEGYYQLNAAIRIDGGSPGTGECMIVIYKNGAEHRRSWNQSGAAFAGTFWTMSISSLVYANGTGDYFEIYAQQSSGADRTVQNAGTGTISWFNGTMARGA
jgi:hypothetical protein